MQGTGRQGQGMFADQLFPNGDPQASLHVSNSIIEKKVLPLFIIGPLCCMLLRHYHFLDGRSWRTTSPAGELSKSEEDSIYDAANKPRERLLQTNLDIGLTQDQVSERQKKYGPMRLSRHGMGSMSCCGLPLKPQILVPR